MNSSVYILNNIENFKSKLLEVSKTFGFFALLDSNNYKYRYSSFDFIAGLDAESVFECYDNKKAISQLNEYISKNKSNIFTVISYDVKNEFEKLYSENIDRLKLPEAVAFVPKYIIELKNNKLTISSKKSKDDIDKIFEFVQNLQLPTSLNSQKEKIEIKAQLSKDEYLSYINKVKNHIKRGDIYELNYCQEFYADVNNNTDIVEIYNKLNKISPMPFSAFYKFKQYFLLSASPERFIKKTGNLLISQPIKGTTKRGKTPTEDEKLKQELKSSKKEIAENVMIVDLVRNDLARVAKKASVEVSELLKVYTFNQVHQLISTVNCTLKDKVSFFDIFKALFPPGSMTGAPKIRAMQLIEKYEQTKRSWYSGSVGYIKPNGDFDFNVIIRSILYNSKINKLNFEVGGAITYLSDAEKEYDECLLKAKAILHVLK